MGLVVAACLIVLFVWPAVSARWRASGSDGTVVSMRVEFDGAAFGSSVNRRLAGDLVVPEFLQDAAMCHNGPSFLADRTLNNAVVVASVPELVRAAELGTSGEFSFDLIRDVELQILSEGESSVLAEADGDDQLSHQIRAYLTSRSEPPGDEAQLRFVAYAVARNLWGDGYLRLVDVTDLDSDAIMAFARTVATPEIHVAGEQSAGRRVDPSHCVAVLDQLGEGHDS